MTNKRKQEAKQQNAAHQKSILRQQSNSLVAALLSFSSPFCLSSELEPAKCLRPNPTKASAVFCAAWAPKASLAWVVFGFGSSFEPLVALLRRAPSGLSERKLDSFIHWPALALTRPEAAPAKLGIVVDFSRIESTVWLASNHVVVICSSVTLGSFDISV